MQATPRVAASNIKMIGVMPYRLWVAVAILLMGGAAGAADREPVAEGHTNRTKTAPPGAGLRPGPTNAPARWPAEAGRPEARPLDFRERPFAKPLFTEEERRARRAEIRRRLDRQIEELRRKEAAGLMTQAERRRLNRLEIIARPVAVESNAPLPRESRPAR